MSADAAMERSEVVAYRINDRMPENYQRAVLEEERRVARDVLGPRDLDRRTILLVGGAGYIGSVLAGHLLARGYRVRCLDLLLFGNDVAVVPFLGHPDFEFIHGDIADGPAVNVALDSVTDAVLLAGLIGDPITKKYPEAARIINDDAHANLLRRLDGRGLNKVVFVSTCSNYGLIADDAVATEDFPLKPLSLYAESKVRTEEAILGLKDGIDYAPAILRFATAFGLSPRMRFDLTVSEFTRDMFLGKDLLVYDAETWRPYCHVQDFAEVIRRTLEVPVDTVAFEVFNAGGDVNNFTKQMIVDAILEFLPDARVCYQQHGVDPRNYKVDFGKIREHLLFEPVHTVRDGIAELIGALRQNVFRDVEKRRNFHGNYEIEYPPSDGIRELAAAGLAKSAKDSV